MIRVLLADAHRLLHPGIQAVLSAANDLTLIGEVTEGDELRKICQQENQPDLLLLSPNVDDSGAAELLDAIRETCPSVKILAMLSHAEEACSRHLMDHGADGVILKSDAPNKLLEAVDAVMQGQPWISAELVAKLVQSRQMDLGNDLTDREIEILQLLAAEKTNEEMAGSLNIAERTVRSHLESIYGKLGVKSRAGAVAQAIRLNLIS